MKKISLWILFVLCFTTVFAGDFVMIRVNNTNDLQKLSVNPNLNIHYFNDSFVLATMNHFSPQQPNDGKESLDIVLLDSNAFSETETYFIVYCNQEEQAAYIKREQQNGKVLLQTSQFLIMKPLNAFLLPSKNDGMVAITNRSAKLPQTMRSYPIVEEENPNIRAMINQIVRDSISSTIQHLQDYESRLYNSSGAFQAKDWLKSQYESFGLSVTLQNFSIFGEPSSPNVIAIQQGTLYPDEYVVCGGHYDSFTYEAFYNSGVAPGADDNASGCSGILETARILSQFQFERSIIYCAFSGEELGLYGSAAYASYCQNQGMNILGYFNIDMSGYLKVGDSIHIDLIYPTSASQLADFYMNVCHVYFPEMSVEHAFLSGGDSDHTSFNNNGYQGIFPFEDKDNHSPYIHTENDVLGLSVNNLEQAKRFTEANLAAVATLAVLFDTTNQCNSVTLSAVLQENNTILSWDEVEDAISYTIYDNGELLENVSETTYLHEDISIGTHCYTVKTNCHLGSSDLSNEECVEYLSVHEKNHQIQFYPNPANQQLHIVGNDIVDVQIFNILGQCVQSINYQGSDLIINTSNYKEGVYIVKVRTKDSSTYINHIVIRH